MTVSEASDHHGSHRRLLWSADSKSEARQPIDAIIVPTARPLASLRTAAELAVVLGCVLVTLHSGKLTTAAKARRELPGDLDLLAVDVPKERRLSIPRFATSSMLTGTVFARRTDISMKRNLGLLLSRMLDWRRVLFLDDDITEVRSNDVEGASGLLDTHNAVGLKVGGFPDNSVVCHAYRDAGGEQQDFIGGGALAVQTVRSSSFFPDIYNEDWFFLLDGKKGLQSVATTGEVSQQAYDPFLTPNRARAEEFGDVLAEGLFWLLDQERSLADADRDHWLTFLTKREQFIKRVIHMVAVSKIEPSEKRRRIAALNGSLHSLSLISPTLCQMYLRAWAADRERWNDYLDAVPKGLSWRQAQNWLSLEGAPRPVLLHPGRAGVIGPRGRLPISVPADADTCLVPARAVPPPGSPSNG